MAPTGWTLTGLPAAGPSGTAGPAAGSSSATPAAGLPPFTAPGGAAAAAGGLGAAPRGRILVIEGGYGNAGRRTWGRGGPTQAPVLSAMLAAVSPQVLLAADAVDAVHLPGASDPHTVLAHLRAASRHPGPLLVHLGGHVVADKRGGQLQLTLRDSKQDGLPWQALAAELSHRPAEWQTLVIADLSADQNAWPYLQGTVSPLSEGIPLWAVVSPDPEQIGTFTRALIEALHGGRPGAGDVLAPEQLRQQVYSVLRPDVVILATHVPGRPVFRNTARRGEVPVADALPVADVLPVADSTAVPDAAPGPDQVAAGQPLSAVPFAPPLPGRTGPQDVEAERPAPATPAGGPVSLIKPGVPPTPPRPARPVSLAKTGEPADEAANVSLHRAAPADTEAEADADVAGTARPAGVTLRKAQSEPLPEAGQDADELAEAADAPEAAEAAEGVGAAEDAGVVEVADGPRPAEAVDLVEGPRDAVPADSAPADSAPVGTAPAGAGPVEAAPTDEGPKDRTPADEAPADQPPTPAGTPVGTPVVSPADAPGAPAPSAPRADYREVIGRIVRSADAGDHAAATDLAFALELEAIAEHGAVSEPVLQVRQVRAHVCRLAGRLSEAADIYREVALSLLRSQGGAHPETQQAATNAEACWRSITDRAEAIRIAPEIIEMRAYLPGPDGRKLRAAERYLAQLSAASGAAGQA
ncbi:hypothetical protein ACGF07_21810 [Kitasatospora sp. NPDC048194]|uniref:hypothetical protein n=1 Tax=Kitasatospora sp. NPDC048194 TaxID=3364045 RepID=UPI00371FE29C